MWNNKKITFGCNNTFSNKNTFSIHLFHVWSILSLSIGLIDSFFEKGTRITV